MFPKTVFVKMWHLLAQKPDRENLFLPRWNQPKCTKKPQKIDEWFLKNKHTRKYSYTRRGHEALKNGVYMEEIYRGSRCSHDVNVNTTKHEYCLLKITGSCGGKDKGKPELLMVLSGETTDFLVLFYIL